MTVGEAPKEPLFDQFLKEHAPIEYECRIVGSSPVNGIEAHGEWDEIVLRCDTCNTMWPCSPIEAVLRRWDEAVANYTQGDNNEQDSIPEA